MVVAHGAPGVAELYQFLLVAAVVFIVVNVVTMVAASRFVLKRRPVGLPEVPRPVFQFSLKSLLIAMAVVALYAGLTRYTPLRHGIEFVIGFVSWCGAIFGTTWALWRARALGSDKLALPLLSGGAIGGAIAVAVQMLVLFLPFQPFYWRLLRVLLQYSVFGGLGGLSLGLFYYGVAKFSVRRL